MFLHAVLPGLLSRYKYNRHKAAKFSSINVDGPNIKIQNGNNAVFPPFNIFVDFGKGMSKVKNDPSFMYYVDVTHIIEKQPLNTFKGKVNTKKTTANGYRELQRV